MLLILALTSCSTLDSRNSELPDDPDAGEPVAPDSPCRSADVELDHDILVGDIQIMQITENADQGVPLLAHRPAFVRVDVRHDGASGEALDVPVEVLIRASRDGTLLGTKVATGPACIPSRSKAMSLETSYYAVLPSSWIVDEIEVVATVEIGRADGTSAPDVVRLPPVGSELRQVAEAPPFNITFVPITIAGATPSVTTTSANAYLSKAQAILPLGDVAARVRTAYTLTVSDETATDVKSQAIRELRELRILDGSSDYYFGILPRLDDLGGGRGFVGLPVSVGVQIPDPWAFAETVAHELGHNMGLRHAPCGAPPNVDFFYPYLDGSIGVAGLDVTEPRLWAPTTPDFMSYCGPTWISDYHLAEVLDFQAHEALKQLNAGEGAPEERLVVSGTIARGRVELTPLIRTTVAPSPPSPGRWTFRLLDRRGRTVDEVAFGFDEIADQEALDDMHFAFTVDAGADALTRIVSAQVLDPDGKVRAQRRPRSDSSNLRVTNAVTMTRGLDGRTSVAWDTDTFEAAVLFEYDTRSVVSRDRVGIVPVPESSIRYELILTDGIRSVAVPIDPR